MRDLHVRFHPDGRTGSEPVHAVRGVDLDLAAGDLVGLVGESGCGKTTVLRAVLGLLPATAEVTGSVTLDGTELVGMGRVGTGERAWRRVRGRMITVVPQGAMAGLAPTRRLGRQLTETLRVVGGLGRGPARDRARAVLADVGLDESLLRCYPHELSGGQRQRAVIGMALACGAGLVLADEPTTGVDGPVRRQLMVLFERLRTEHGLGLLLVTHDLPTVLHHADEVTVMYAGRVVEKAPAQVIRDDAHHPYTRGLVASVPSQDARGTWSTVPGSPPTLAPPPPGCAFADRCPLVDDHCRLVAPELSPHRGSLTACHHADRVQEATYPGLTGTTARTRGPVLSMRGVTVDLGRGRRVVRALDGLDLDIAKGEVVGLVGPSGSGKSTAVRVVLGLVAPVAGTVSVRGEDVLRATGAQLRVLRRQIGFVHQDPYGSVREGTSVGDAVAEPLRMARTPSAQIGPLVRQALLDAGLDPDVVLDRRPGALSGGQRQRVAIARAVVTGPKLLLCDEATTMLDASTRGGVARTLRRLADERGLAVLVVTHDLGEAAHLCDRVTVLDAGRPVATGRPDEVLPPPSFPPAVSAPLRQPSQADGRHQVHTTRNSYGGSSRPRTTKPSER